MARPILIVKIPHNRYSKWMGTPEFPEWKKTMTNRLHDYHIIFTNNYDVQELNVLYEVLNPDNIPPATIGELKEIKKKFKLF